MISSIIGRCYTGFTAQLKQQFRAMETTVLIEMERSKDDFCICLHKDVLLHDICEVRREL